MIERAISVRLDLPGDKEIKQHSNEEIGPAMDVEIKAFQEWFASQGNDRLVGAERAILKTYLAWKLLYEEGRPDDQD